MEPQQNTSDTTKYVVGIIIIALVIVGVSFANRDKKPGGAENNSADKEVTEQTNAMGTIGNENAEEAIITPAKNVTEIVYTNANGFTPDEISIKVGDTVKFVNKSSDRMWVASDIHPTHEIYSDTTLKEHCPDTAGIAFDQCGAGDEYSFTFAKAGSWKFHNHARASMGGTITVK